MATLKPNFQLTRLGSSQDAHRDHRLATHSPQPLPCCVALTKATWSRAAASWAVSLHKPSKALPSNPKGRKASCFCVRDDAAGEYKFEEDGGGDGVGASSWLHYLMDHAGIDTSHAQVRVSRHPSTRSAECGNVSVVCALLGNVGMILSWHGFGRQAARRNYAEEVANLRMAPDGSQCAVDLARAALEVAAEDDALVSHSPVPLPVDAYLNRLHAMALEFAGHYLPPQCDNPHHVLEALDLYLFGYQVGTLLSQTIRVFWGCRGACGFIFGHRFDTLQSCSGFQENEVFAQHSGRQSVLLEHGEDFRTMLLLSSFPMLVVQRIRGWFLET